MKTVLYDYWRSSAAYRIRIAFNLAGLPYESVPVDLLAGENRSPEHLARNPQGLVPVADIGGLVFSQSLAIIEYLDEAGHFSFLPKDLLGRAQVRTISYVIAMETHAVCNVSVARYAEDSSRGHITMSDWMARFIPRSLEALESMVAESGKHCFGNRITMADICLVPQIYNTRRWKLSLDPYPSISKISAHLEALPAFRDAHPDLFRP